MSKMPKRVIPLAFASGALASGLLAIVACSKRPSENAAASVDAGTRAPVQVYAGPFEPHLVARMLATQTALVPLADGSVVLQTGLFRYTLSADGTATRIGDLASYATKMPAEDVQLGGYDVEAFVPDQTVPGARAWHDLRGTRSGRMMPEGWALPDDIDVPPNIRGDDLRRAADGTTVLLTRDVTPEVSRDATRGATRDVKADPSRSRDGTSERETYVTFVAPPKSRHVTRVAIDGLDTARAGLWCEHVPSWERPHLFCGSWRDGITSVHRLVGQRWERIPLAEEHARNLRVGAVGPDGALWLGLHAGSVMRISVTGTTDTFDMPTADPALARASYGSMQTYARPGIAGQAGANDDSLEGVRRWEGVVVTPGTPPRPISHVRQIVPRADGEAWVLASESHDANVLVHMSRPAIAPLPEPLVVGSDTDQRNELRNLKEPVTWVAHCPQLFVTLARARADGSLPAETVWSREREINAIVRKVAGNARADAPTSLIVEGRLAGRHVAGVLVLRSDPIASEDLLEKTAAALATELSSMTGATPHVTCTVPVLERAALVGTPAR